MFGAYNEVAGFRAENKPPSSSVSSLPSETVLLRELSENAKVDMYGDCILISEFCEIQGPVPLLTIPCNASIHPYSFSSLAIRLMAVDYQSSSRGHLLISPDTEVVHYSLYPGLYSCSTYLTLCDAQARGFVRPMCISYLTQSKHKLLRHWPAIRRGIQEATRMLKFSNRRWFCSNVTYLLSDLGYTKRKFIQWKRKAVEKEMLDERKEKENSCSTDIPAETFQSEEERVLSQINLDSLAGQVSELNHVLDVVLASLVDEWASSVLSSWESKLRSQPTLSYNSILSSLNPTPGEPRIVTGKRAFESKQPLSCLCGVGVLPSLWILLQTHIYFSVPLSILSLREVEAELLRSSKELFFLKDCVVSMSSGFGHNKTEVQTFKVDLDGEAALKSSKLMELFLQDTSSSLSDSLSDEYVIKKDETVEEGEFVLLNMDTDMDSFEWVHPMLPEAPLNNFMYLTVQRSQNCRFKVTCPADIFFNFTQVSSGLVSGGHELSRFFHLFPHVISSLLSGRPLIIAGSPLYKKRVDTIVSALSLFLPASDDAVLRWHTGIIVNHHINQYLLIGLCVPERLIVQELMSNATLNKVTVVNVETSYISGPAYPGTILSKMRCDQKVGHRTLLTNVLSVLLQLGLKLQVYRKVWSCAPKQLGRKEVLRSLGVDKSDGEIIRYLSQVLQSS